MIHHAYLIFGGRVEGATREWQRLINQLSPEPEIELVQYEVLGIGEARQLRGRQNLAGQNNQARAFIIQALTLTLEAQNALLKMLEEPRIGNYFFFLLPTKTGIIDTLISRCQVIDLGSSLEVEIRDLAKKIITNQPEERLALITGWLKKYEDEPMLLRERSRSLVRSLGENYRYQASPAFLAELLKVSNYLGDRASSPKLLLEHLVLSLPNVV